jgi:hypothetical protein
VSDRPTPFALAFGALAGERFPEIAAALALGATSSADRDAFVLVQPAGALLQDLIAPDAPAEAVDAYIRLLHHAYRHWTAGRWVYRVSDTALARAASGGPLSTHLARPALYLQLPEHRVWRVPAPGETAEPLDGMFVTESAVPGTVAVLGISGMHRHRPGFSAVAVDGHADADDPTGEELLVAVRREDGSPPFAPLLPGGREAGLYSVANAGELLLLTCRLLARLPAPGAGPGGTGDADTAERFVDL